MDKFLSLKLYTTQALPTPTEVATQLTSASSVRVTWQWTCSGLAPSCFNTTTVTYHPEGSGESDESSLQISDPATTETTLQCNTSYTITVVATAGEIQKGGGSIPSTTRCGILNSWSPVFVVIMWCLSIFRSTELLSSCAVSYLSTFNMGGSLPHTTIPHPLQGDMWLLCWWGQVEYWSSGTHIWWTTRRHKLQFQFQPDRVQWR